MLKYLAKTFSISVTVAFAILAATWPMQADMLDGAMILAKSILPPNVVSKGPYTLTALDCLRPAVRAGTGASGFFQIILPPATSVPDGCKITIQNGDIYSQGGRGKSLSNFPTGWFSILWPTQAGEVIASNGTWATSKIPGRWNLNGNGGPVTFHVDSTVGNNANDGLAAGSGNALADAQTAWTITNYQFDTYGNTTIIAMACSMTHTVGLNMGGTPLGSNLIQLSPDGNCSFTWSVAGPVVTVGDLAEFDMRFNYYGSSGGAQLNNTLNTAGSGALYLHNAIVLDGEASTTSSPTVFWGSGGGNANFIYCDGPCEFAWGASVQHNQGATGNYMFYLSEGGKGTIGGVFSGNGNTDTGLIWLFGPALLNVGGPGAGSGWTTIGASGVFGKAVLVNNGVTIPGGVTLGAGSGANCSSLTATNC